MKYDKSRWPELYLDWVNNFLTIEHFAEHYSMTVEHAKEIIEHEREKPNELVEIGIPFSGFYESIHERMLGGKRDERSAVDSVDARGKTLQCLAGTVYLEIYLYAL